VKEKREQAKIKAFSYLKKMGNGMKKKKGIGKEDEEKRKGVTGAGFERTQTSGPRGKKDRLGRNLNERGGKQKKVREIVDLRPAGHQPRENKASMVKTVLGKRIGEVGAGVQLQVRE